MSEATIRKLLLLGALYHLAIGGWFLLAPGSAYDTLAEFPPRNDHFLRDVSSFYLAFGLAFWVAARRPSWRAPVLALAAVQYAIHTVIHVFDVGEAATDGKGIFSAVSLGIATAILIFLLGALLGGREKVVAEVRDREPEPAPEPAAAAPAADPNAAPPADPNAAPPADPSAAPPADPPAGR